MPQSLGFQIFNRLLIRKSNWVFSRVLHTKPIETAPESNTLLYSILDKRNCHAYLLAAKSFLQYCPPLRVVIQDDGSLTSRQLSKLKFHLPNVEMLSKQSTLDLLLRHEDPLIRQLTEQYDRYNIFIFFQLLNLLIRFPGKNIIQMDSDILFLKKPEFILEWIDKKQGEAFHSGGGNNLTERVRQMKFELPHVDVSRFNAGLFGFQNHLDEEDYLSVLHKIEQLDPSFFEEWEAAQAIWAILLNNLKDVVCLDDLRTDYVGNGWKNIEELNDNSVVVHFVGTTRFRNLTYPRLGYGVMNTLQSQNGHVL